MAVQTVIKKRRDTAANWLSVNPVLSAGEEGFETDSGLSKVGNGTDAWVDLDYNSIAVVKENVKNSTGSTIAKGAVVYISGANGDNALISLADADSEATSSKTLGFASASIANGAIGTVTTNGILKGVNTGSATAGQSVWLSSTAGGFVFNTPPAKPAHSVYLGVVVRAHSVNGAILVKVQNGYELEELHNVSITNPATGDVLTYDSVSGLWINSEGGTGSASITVSDTAPADPQADSMWWNSAEGTAYIRYDNTWVPLSPGIAGPAGPTGVIVSDTAPTNTAQLWADPNATGSYVVPANGSKGQVLTKITDTSYDTGWATPQGSGNSIINSAFDVWQRGTSFAPTSAAWTYTADRWDTGRSAATSGSTVTRQASGLPGTQYCLRWQRNSGDTSLASQWLVHRFDSVNSIPFAGKTVTFSFYARAGANYSNASNALKLFTYSGTGTDQGGFPSLWTGSTTIVNGQNFTLSTSWQRFTVTYDVASNATQLGFLFEYVGVGTAGSADYYEITNVQFEAGVVASPFRRNASTFQAELAACQRYYFRNTGNSYTAHGNGVGANSNQADFMIKLPTAMRVAPTLVDYSNLAIFDGVNVISGITNAIMQPLNVTTDTAYVSVTKSASVTQFRPYFLINSNSTSGYLGFSAEL